MAFLSAQTAVPLSLFCLYWIIYNKYCAQESLLVAQHSSFMSNPCLLSFSTLLECGRSLHKLPRFERKQSIKVC